MHLRDGFLADQLDPIYVAYNMWIIGFIKTFLSLTTFDINIEVILEEEWYDEIWLIVHNVGLVLVTDRLSL